MLILFISTGQEPYAVHNKALLNERIRRFQEVTVRLGQLAVFPVKDPTNPMGQKITLNARVSQIILSTILSLLQIDPTQRPTVSTLLNLPL